jgi:uncharacterized protein YbjT (DUF2867 family)
MHSTNSHHTVLVLGGTGKTGRRVAERLRAQGIAVRIGSRAADPPFDWQDRAGWPAVLDGVRAVYVCYHPDLAMPGAPDDIGAFAGHAARAGVARLVLLSGRGEEEAQRAEEAARASGLELTVLRCSWFAQNFTEGALAPDVASGELVLPVGDVPEPFVDVEDVADAAVVALVEDGHAGRVYELTGPRLLTFGQAVAELGGDARFRSIGMDDYTAALAGHGVPEGEIAALAYLFGEVLDGRNATLADGVRQILGRAPRDIGEALR